MQNLHAKFSIFQVYNINYVMEIPNSFAVFVLFPWCLCKTDWIIFFFIFVKQFLKLLSFQIKSFLSIFIGLIQWWQMLPIESIFIVIHKNDGSYLIYFPIL